MSALVTIGLYLLAMAGGVFAGVGVLWLIETAIIRTSNRTED